MIKRTFLGYKMAHFPSVWYVEIGFNFVSIVSHRANRPSQCIGEVHHASNISQCLAVAKGGVHTDLIKLRQTKTAVSAFFAPRQYTIV